jgi:hypothetical protein
VKALTPKTPTIGTVQQLVMVDTGVAEDRQSAA